MSDIDLPQSSGKTEWKVKAASLGTFVASIIGLTILQSTVTDLAAGLPDWAETIALSLIMSGVTWASGYAARTKPANLSQSTIDAFQEWLKGKLPHVR